MTALTNSMTNRTLHEAEIQLELCEDLILALRRDWTRNKRKEKRDSLEPIANATQIQSDIRKLRRELLYLNELLSKRGVK